MALKQTCRNCGNCKTQKNGSFCIAEDKFKIAERFLDKDKWDCDLWEPIKIMKKLEM